MSVNEFPSSLLDSLRPQIQFRDERQFSLSNVISIYQSVPNKIALWPMSSVDTANTGNVYDISGATRTLTNINLVKFDYDGLIPYAKFLGSNIDRLQIVDSPSLDIIGNETYVETNNGLTISLWVKFDALGTQETIISKYNSSGNQRSWLINKRADNTSRFIISLDGTGGNSISVTSSTTLTTDWHNIVARYTPSTELTIFIDGVEETPNTTAIYATIFNSTADLFLSGNNPTAGPVDLFTGKLSMVVISASALSDTIIQNQYFQVKTLFQNA